MLFKWLLTVSCVCFFWPRDDLPSFTTFVAVLMGFTEFAVGGPRCRTSFTGFPMFWYDLPSPVEGFTHFLNRFFFKHLMSHPYGLARFYLVCNS